MPPNGAEPRRRVGIGFALIAATTAVAALIFFLDGIVESVRDTTSIVAVLPGAPGLRAGAAVWIAGRPAGRVSRIAILRGSDTTALIVADLTVPAGASLQIRQDAAIRVTSARRIGEPALDILPGSPAMPPFPPGDTLYAHDATTFDDVRLRAGAVHAGIDSLAASAAALSAPFSRSAGAARRVLAHAEAARDEFAALAHALDQGSFALLDDPALGRAIANLRDAGHSLQTGLDRSAPVRRDIGTASSALRQRIDRLVARLDTLGALERNGTLARFREDSAFTHALHAVRAQLDSLIAEAKANPLRFIF